MKLIKDYINIIYVTLLVIFLLRVIELIFIIYNFGLPFRVINFEIIGFLLDLIIIGFFLYLWYFPYRLVYKRYPKFTNIIFLFGIIVFDALHLSILKYFLYQLRPLDIFLYSHSLRESLFSYKTSNTNYSDVLLISIFISAVVIISYRTIKNRVISDKEAKKVKLILLGTIILFPIFEMFGVFNFNNFTINKSYYFYKRSIGYVFDKGAQKFMRFDKKNISQFQNFFDGKDYISTEYPLLHRFENSDVLGSYFEKSQKKPNLVYIIVEGMSDEFIHDFKGVKFMPFIDSLSKSSLYWDNFFTLGERSFAVVPSITGGLPYGERGFTLLNKLPYHFSLVNILKKNGYYSIYFDSQDAWFHDKDKYFMFDNIDMIFDKMDFSSEFKKVKVGKEKNFWGFTDKDLFNQALITMDTLPEDKRLEVYFTGTMHSPFYIDEKEKYISRFENNTKHVKNENTLEFFDVYKKQLLSLMYTNDAIQMFLDKYKTRDEYKNTIFIITGDHPMTEIPPEDGVKKYHVPLIIYSPMLKTHKTFHGISSHLDVFETMLSFLNTNYKLDIPKISTSLGYKLDTSSRVKYDRVYTFMNDNREIVDLYDKGSFLSNEKYVFKVKPGFKIYEIKNAKTKRKLEKKLDVFNNVNDYVTLKDKLLLETDYMSFFGYKLAYSYRDTTCTTFNDEYSYIVEDIPISNDNMYIDISLEYTPKINEKTSVYCVLSAENGDVLSTNSYNLAFRLQEHIKIKKNNISNSTIYLSVYMDNKTHKKKEYCKPAINVYRY